MQGRVLIETLYDICTINFSRFGPRFPPMSRAYNKEIRDICKESAKELELEDILHEG